MIPGIQTAQNEDKQMNLIINWPISKFFCFDVGIFGPLY